MLNVIVLAAGQSRRMHSKTSKIFHTLGGKKVIEYVLDAFHNLNPERMIVVVSESLKDNEFFRSYTTVVQEEPLGTAHAVQVALSALTHACDEVIIAFSDTPCVTPETLKKLYTTKGDLVVAGMKLFQNHIHMPYGRLLLDAQGYIQKNVEYKDIFDDVRMHSLANMGFYKIKTDLLKKLLAQVDNKNTGGEFYLTDIIEYAYNLGTKAHLVLADYEEAHGINNRHDLALAEQILQERWCNQWMEQGITLRDPRSIFLSHDTKAGQDTEIEPFVTFGPGVKLGKNVKILSFCHIEYAHIEDFAIIGPFAHIRGCSHIRKKGVIGNFVELKGSHVGESTKVKHLSYIGDAVLGARTNIGAGTITANYDGVNKHKTIIGDDVKVGANTSLVAPLTIGHRAVIGAGSAITQNVEDDALALERGEQIIKKGYTSHRHSIK